MRAMALQITVNSTVCFTADIKIHQRSTFTETEIFITGCTRSCHFGNFQCSQWWTFHQNYEIFVLALVTSEWPVGFLYKTKGQQSGKYFQVLTWSWLPCFVCWRILIPHCSSLCSSRFQNTGTPFLTWFNFNPRWISNHMTKKLWDEILYPFPNFNGTTVEVWEWIKSFIPHFMICAVTYLCWVKS